MRNSSLNMLFAVFLSLNLCLCPQNHGAMQTLPRKNQGAMLTLRSKIMEPLFFPLQNYRAVILCPAKLWSNADFAPQNHGDIVSGAKITTKNYPKIRFSFLFFLLLL